MPGALAPIEVFCSYAPEDESHFQSLQVHLSMLRRQGLISIWHHRQIAPGTDWAQAIDTHLETASLILLLVSADFLATDYCYNIEMQRAMQCHEAGIARVLPIIVRPCDWNHAPFARLHSLPREGKPVTTWDNRDLAWHDVIAGIRRLIEDLPLLSTSAPRTALPAVWSIPYPRNPFFIDRDDLLSSLHTQLQTGQVTALSQLQAISGLGGIGKTQTAVEYAYRYHQEYDVVLWASADNQETLTASYSTLATLLDLPEQEALEQEMTIRAIKRWLQTHRRWLLILDNADNLDLLPAFLPPSPGGHILLTTRAWDMQRLAHRIHVEALPLEWGAIFLLRRATLIAPDEELLQASMEDSQIAKQIVQELGGLPLALDQAGAYLEATGISLKQYQHIYQRHRNALLRERRARVYDHPEPVASTWSLSFKQVEQHNAAAAELLRLCAYLAPDAIPENIITQGAPHLGPLLEPVAADPFLLSQAVEALRAYSLIHRDPRTQTLSVHRLVQTVLRDSMVTEAEKQWKQRAVRAVEASCPNVEDVAQWDACELWLPHAQICATWIEQEDMILPEAADLLNEAGYYLDDRARYAEAEPMYLRALAIRERYLGPEHLITAVSLNNLALLYQNQGKYADAEPLYKCALAIREQQLGAEHPGTAQSLNNLAFLYQSQNRYEEVEQLYKRALAIHEQQLGTNHPNTSASLNNLASLYQNQGRYAEAEPLYERSLVICEQQLGAEHPDTATSLNNLASLYESQGRYEDVEPLYERSLAIRERWLGTDHPDTAQSLDNLAGFYKVQGRYGEAESLYKRALAIREKQLGMDHPDTATSLNNLAGFYRSQDEHEKAEPLYKRAVTISEHRLGAKHPDTQLFRRNYVSFLYEMGRDEEAALLETN